ncbi:hypothetical protein BTTAP_50023 [Brochothrix thermosphacta]|nr:hypothetical protein BTTAP_50023 [Brochothrix thermosphacta]
MTGSKLCDYTDNKKINRGATFNGENIMESILYGTESLASFT